MSPSACVSNRSPLFVWFARRVSPRGRGPQLFRSTVEDLFPFVFVLRRRTISARVSSTSPDTNANVSRVIGIFETAVCHCRSLFTRYHPSPLPIGENPTMQPVYTCLPLYFLPPLFFSSLFFFFSRPPLSSSYKSAFNERERERERREKICETE